MESFKNNVEYNIYNHLKENFLNGNISFIEVRDELLKIDQETHNRVGAEANLKFLKDKKIVDKVNNSPEELKSYERFICFTLFHVGQNLAFKGDQNAYAYIEESLDYAKSSQSDDSWISYINGTLNYLQGVEIPNSLIEKVDQDKNKQILIKLNEGLKERGYPDYSLDY